MAYDIIMKERVTDKQIEECRQLLDFLRLQHEENQRFSCNQSITGKFKHKIKKIYGQIRNRKRAG